MCVWRDRDRQTNKRKREREMGEREREKEEAEVLTLRNWLMRLWRLASPKSAGWASRQES